MTSSRLIKKLQNHIKQPPYFIIQALLNRIPYRPLQVAKFFVLDLEKLNLKTIRGLGVVREGSPADVPGMCILENKDESVFLKRFNEGEFCSVAILDGVVIGYVWFSDKPFHLEERFRYRLFVPDDAVYAYDGFISRENRLAGTWPLLMKHLLDRAQMLGRRKLVAMIDYGNDPSLKAHLRFGFNVYRQVLWIRVLKQDYFCEKNIAPGCFNPREMMSR